jgi:hypothetical protein
METYEIQLKLKDLEIENLKSQLKMKDEIINLLKQQQQPTTINSTNNIIPRIELVPDNKRITTPKEIIEMLNEKRQTAKTIDEFIKTELYGDYNKYFKYIQFNPNESDVTKKLFYYNKFQYEAAIPNTTDGLFTFTSLNNAIVNVFCSIIQTIDKAECPLYCNDIRRRIFYVKLSKGWKRMTDDEFDEIMANICCATEIAVSNTDLNAFKLNEYFKSKFKKFYPNGLKNDEIYQLRRDHFKTILNLQTSDSLTYKHLKTKLSEITGDKLTRFVPLPDEPIEIEYEENENEADYEENEEY